MEVKFVTNRKFKALRPRTTTEQPFDVERGMRNIRMIVSAVYSAAAQVAAEEAAKQSGCTPVNT